MLLDVGMLLDVAQGVDEDAGCCTLEGPAVALFQP